MTLRALTEVRIGIIVAVVGAVVTLFFGYQSWIGYTLYNQNGQISTLTADSSDTKQTTHEILNIILTNKQTAEADTTPL